MNYENIIEIIQSKRRFGQAYGCDVTHEMMGHLDNPDQGMRIIHIAGTNGKGSTAAFVSSILQAADFVVGQFTSPHLISFRERIMVNGEMISQEDVVRIGEQILSLPMELECTMFDICLGIAMVYFKEQGCDFVVLETGLGGAKDSTTGLTQVPVVSAITNIGFDHMAILGNTIEEIAAEKAGIMKAGTVAVIGNMDVKARQVIEAKAKELHVKCENVDNLLTKISTYKIGLNGGFQRDNAALAVGIVEALFNNQSGYLLDKYFTSFKAIQEEGCATACDGHCDACGAHKEMDSFSDWKNYVISKGLAEAKWPGRMEILEQDPFVLVDGAHNPQGVEALFNSLAAGGQKEKYVLVVGVMADKDYINMMKLMLPIAECFYTVTVGSERSLPAEALADQLAECGASALACNSLEEALTIAKNKAKEQQQGVVIFGSLYFVGEVKKLYEVKDGKNSF